MSRALKLASLAVALVLLGSCTRAPQERLSETGQQRQQAEEAAKLQTYEQTVAAQDGVNRYFHREVVPRLRECWSRVRGNGNILFTYTYTRATEGWTLTSVAAGVSSLPTGEDAVARDCMEQAVKGTTLLAVRQDNEAKELSLHWSWPVPMPSSTEMARMIIGTDRPCPPGTCGCPEGPSPQCNNCAVGPVGTPPNCVKVCSGYTECGVDPDGTCRLRPINPPCVSGGIWGNVGGATMY